MAGASSSAFTVEAFRRSEQCTLAGSSETPAGRSIGLVRAEDAGADRVLQMAAQRRMLLRDARDRVADAARDGFPRTVGDVAGLARSTADAECARQLLGEEVDLL